MKLRASMLLAAAAMLLPASAGAQRTEATTGSNIGIARAARIPDAARMSDMDRGRVAMAQFARCSLTRGTTGVARALMLADYSTQQVALRRGIEPECLNSGEMRFRPQAYRGALFTELYRRKAHNERGLPSFTLLGAPADGDNLHMWLMDFARCVVARDHDHSRAFVLSQEVSAEERAAVHTLAPSFGPCVPAGQTVPLNREVVEGALAEVLYAEPVQ